MSEILSVIFNPEFGYSVLRVSTPIIFAALAAIITNKAGVLNIAFEGIMLWASLTCVIASAMTKSVWVGLIAGILTGVVMALLLSYFALKLNANIVLTGLAINTFASGGTVFLLFLVTGDRGVSVGLNSLTVPKLSLGFIQGIPVIGKIFANHNILTYVAFISVYLVWLLLYRTPLGLRIRAVGENPNAAESVGINVIKTRFIALVLGGAIASLGGVYMSMGYLTYFTRDMVAGRGFIGIAAQNLGGGNPLPTLIASLVFGVADSLSNLLQTVDIPAEFVQMIPYVTTIIGLVIYSSTQQKAAKKSLVKAASVSKEPIEKPVQ